MVTKYILQSGVGAESCDHCPGMHNQRTALAGSRPQDFPRLQAPIGPNHLRGLG